MMKHIQKITNGRKYSLNLDIEADRAEFFANIANSYNTATDARLKNLVAKSWKGLMSGCSPTLCETGVGGTYFMRDEFNRTVGVFKPQDEEMGCLNNPKGFTPKSDSYHDNSAQRGVLVGEAAFRECAAYILDHEHFSGVPATDLVVCSHPSFNSSPLVESSGDNVKIGSFQEFRDHDYDAQDISPAKASRFPVKEVHKIAILDIRLFNTDRHGGNILVRKVYNAPNSRPQHLCDHADFCDFEDIVFGPQRRHMYDSDADENGALDSHMQFQMEMESDEEVADENEAAYDSSDCDDDSVTYELIPIDHGYTLPHTLTGLVDSWFEWLNWPQARMPFSKETLEYISRLDAERDIVLLHQRFGDWIRPECYKVLRITTLWLKTGAALGLTPYDIGQMMCRKNIDMPSDLEKMCWEAEEVVQREGGEGIDLDLLLFQKLVLIMQHSALAKMKKGGEVQAKYCRPPPQTLFVD
jgi:hypothetical protein